MADEKITGLTELTTPVDADLLAIVDDVAGTATTKKVTRANLFGGADNAIVSTSETETSTSYDDMTTSGPAVTVTVRANGRVRVTLTCDMSNSNTNTANFMSFAISGAHTLSAADARSLRFAHPTATAVSRFSATYLLESITAGSSVFTAKYKVAAGTGTFANRDISVEPL